MLKTNNYLTVIVICELRYVPKSLVLHLQKSIRPTERKSTIVMHAVPFCTDMLIVSDDVVNNYICKQYDEYMTIFLGNCWFLEINFPGSVLKNGPKMIRAAGPSVLVFLTMFSL